MIDVSRDTVESILITFRIMAESTIKPHVERISFDPSLLEESNKPIAPKPDLIGNNPINKSKTPTEYWPENPRARERSLSRAISVLYNPAEHYMDTEWVARRATFLHHLDDSEKKFDAELVADMKRWNQEIIDSEWALNDLATPKQWPACSRGNMPSDWDYKGKRYTTEQDLRKKWPPIPLHRYRHFKHEHELILPENWEEIHQRSIMVGSKLHPLSEIFYQRGHDLVILYF